mmetsp:Transcript_55971/g.145953  ORF Transcript_55971/g.145953 Transcript_55971/m.145953 type:complete len:354 (+) Transcript_55971:182-1243(+)
MKHPAAFRRRDNHATIGLHILCGLELRESCESSCPTASLDSASTAMAASALLPHNCHTHRSALPHRTACLWGYRQLRRRRQSRASAVLENKWLARLWNRGVHRWTVAVALNQCHQALVRPAPSHFANSLARHGPLGIAVEGLPKALHRIWRLEVDQSIAQASLRFDMDGKVDEVVHAREAFRIERGEQHLTGVVYRHVSEHNCCPLLLAHNRHLRKLVRSLQLNLLMLKVTDRVLLLLLLLQRLLQVLPALPLLLLLLLLELLVLLLRFNVFPILLPRITHSPTSQSRKPNGAQRCQYRQWDAYDLQPIAPCPNRAATSTCWAELGAVCWATQAFEVKAGLFARVFTRVLRLD